jgi:transcriptional regulator with XRE-family HTH domain
MAATTGVTTAMLSRLEHGEVRPTRQTARRVAAGYGLSWARVMTICAGAPDEHIAVEWFRGRAAALRAEAAELEALADEMEGDDRSE